MNDQSAPGETRTTLIDPVTAQYIHTLTVTGRHEGHYKCCVSNDVPSQACADIVVEGMYSVMFSNQ